MAFKLHEINITCPVYIGSGKTSVLNILTGRLSSSREIGKGNWCVSGKNNGVFVSSRVFVDGIEVVDHKISTIYIYIIFI